MATGTGKTKTAMFAACQLAQVLGRREQPLVLLIIVPLQHLVDQWIHRGGVVRRQAGCRL